MGSQELEGICLRALHAHFESSAWRELFRYQEEEICAPFVALQAPMETYFIEQVRGQPRPTSPLGGSLMGSYYQVKSKPTPGRASAYQYPPPSMKPSALLTGLLSRMYDQEA